MKTFKPILLLALGLLLTTTSCRTEDDLSIDPPQETTLAANSALASQMQRIAMNDGSVDNIVYNANCFTIQLPITVTINSVVITINDIGNYDDIEDLLDEFDDDDDTVDIDFPISIILADYTEIEINSLDELEDYADDCNDENEDDDDIECIDFVYPITASVFNSNNEVIATVTFNSDSDLYGFIDDIEDDDFVGFNFPVSIVISDGSVLVINNFNELEDAIDIYEDDCDDDDDYDYNDDDCNNCTPDQLESVLTACSDWYIDELERNDQDLEDNYSGYLFNFFADNTITVSWDGNTADGTWSASGTGNNITVTFNIPGFEDINDTWNLYEIENDDDEVEVKFEIGDDDELDFKNDNCN
ncbi:hypothetical protein ESY86_06785 [Subsaximicrobium wynnwilliamsii]|uniref:Uncharacterized protein n=1 Tax=Subsaximicrobium wynnwilliamsii TaxID=291179 RepID=A0A5C6ZJG7_9FLAO|nr:hypothetical protein [Subsaximicrobium wynnwilliamsii]TXD84278.1 hypothetical protein ESY87_07200 [Subsaximicrobium wynnwilliamsii]TXD89899.1 hypothetical protein ESY86_06785 [Subsaximicrobium wynnwilliamsii]TXE03990.1 hypothetical protein ESY88_07195 [Subsaximicrobium wynnwilliamsii]